MPKFTPAITRAGFFAAVGLFIIMGGAATWTHAQESAPAQNPSSSSASSQRPQGEPSIREKENQAEREESEDIQDSATIRWISGHTGMTTRQTFWVCTLINFAIVVFAAVYLLRKLLPGMFKSRTESIQKHLEEARRTSEEARSRLTEVEARLSRLDVEIEAMRRQAEENARAEDRRIMAESEQERQRIVTTAEQEIAMAAGTARRELQAYAAELAVDLAAKKIRVGADTDQALVRDFTSWLGKDGN